MLRSTEQGIGVKTDPSLPMRVRWESLVYVICEYSGARRFVVLMTFKKENLEDIYFTTALIRGHWFSVTWPRVV